MKLRELEELSQHCEETGDYGSAEKFLREILALKKEIFGDSHECLIDPLFNLGLICWAQNQFEQAQVFLHQALELSKIHRGKDSEQTLEISRSLVDLVNERQQVAKEVIAAALVP